MDRDPSKQTFVQDLSVLFQSGAIGGLSDRELLGLFAARSGEPAQRAFETIVRRHGPMVLGVCRRILGDVQLAEDAFQATFLVLAIKAGGVRKPDSLGPWLHGVASRISRRAREGRSPKLEQVGLDSAIEDAGAGSRRVDLIDALDEEIGRLPASYRRAIILCYLEGRTQEEAARALGWTKGTVSGRLARAKDLLRARLTRRGLAPSAGLLAGLSAEGGLAAVVPASLAATTARVAHGVILGRAETVAASAAVMTLARSGLRTLALGKLKVMATFILLATTLVAGVAWTNAGPALSEEVTPDSDVKPSRVLRVSQPTRSEPREIPPPKGARLRLGTTRLRHEAHVTTVGFSPNGKTLASASWDGVVRFWDVATGRSVGEIPDRPRLGVAFTAVYSPDGSKMAIGRDAGVVQLWDLKADKEIFQSKAHQGRVQGVAFSPDGKLLATMSDELQFVRLWDVASGKQLRSLDDTRDNVHRGSLAFDRAGRRLASGASSMVGHGESICIWDLNVEGKPLVISKAHDYNLANLEFLPGDGGLISCGSRYEQVPGKPGEGAMVPEIKVWDPVSGKHLRDIETGRRDFIDGLALSRDGAMLVSSQTYRLIAWDISAGKVRREIPARANLSAGSIGGVAISRDARLIAARRGDNTVHLWDLATSKPLLSDDQLHETSVMAIAISPDGRSLATGGQDGVIQRWDLGTGKHLGRLEMAGHGYVYSVRYTPDGKSIVASSEWSKPYAGFIGNLRVWDAVDGRLLQDIEVPNRAVSAAISRDGRLIAVAEDNVEERMFGDRDAKGRKPQPLIEVFDLRDGRRVAQLMGENRRIAELAFSGDGKMLVSIGEDSFVRTWDIDRGRELRGLEAAGHMRDDHSKTSIRAAAISPDGTIAVTSGLWDDRLIVRELKTGKIRHTIHVLKNGGAYLGFAPDGRVFASVSATQNHPQGDDITIHLWDAVDGRELMQLDPDGRRIRSLGFSPDGRTLVTGMEDTTTLIWDVSAAYAAAK